MDNTRAQQKALDDELVAPADHLKIGKSNLRLSSILKSKEPTLQVALDALKLTPFYKAFEISADVPEIYIQEFWVTVFGHHSLLRFKLNGKIHTVNVDNFKEMLKICPKLPDLVYQVENKNSKKNNDMYYPRFTKVIVDYLMAKDQGIPRRNKMFWHYSRDDFMFTTVRVISKHQDTQVYGAILPQHLTNQAMLESEAYMTYRAYATGEKTPKPKSTKKKVDSESSPKPKLTQVSKGKRIKTLEKGDKPTKKKQSTTNSKGLMVLSEVALIEAEQMKIALERSKIQTHSSHASGSGDGVDIQLKVPDEQQQHVSGINEGAGKDDEDNDKHDSENGNDDEDDDQENKKKKIKRMMMMLWEENKKDEEDKELYEDLNLNLDRRDAEMIDAQTNQETEEFHMTLTTEPPVVKAQVSKIMPKVEKYVTESLGAEVLARSSNQPQTSYVAASSLSKFELKKNLIDKIEENKSMNRSDIQKNL
ncbi:hypothetical protein Tco_0321079 [Tanacetum coccineum]